MENEEIYTEPIQIEMPSEVFSEGSSEEVFSEDPGNERAEQPIDNSDDSSSMASSVSSNDNTSLEDLLRNYFSSEASSSDSSGEAASYNQVDYSSMLQQLIDYSEDAAAFDNSLQVCITEYQDHNTFSSDLDDISLTNGLLLLCFVATLFVGVLAFARRIL